MKTIEENNRLIGEFMGLTICTESEFNNGDIELTDNLHILEWLHYHASWDLLMPVVEKIESMLPDDSFITITNKTCIIPMIGFCISDYDIEVSDSTKILAVYRAIVEFINAPKVF